MKRFAPAVLLLALGTAACGGDGPTDRTPSVARVYVSPGEANINVGETTQLMAQARDDKNATIAGTPFTWQALDAAVSVSPEGLVTGLAGGTARVVGSAANGAADTAVITVVTVAQACTEAGPAAQLAVGGSVRLTGAEAALLCLEGHATGAEYVVIPFHGTRDAEAMLPLRLAASGVQAAAGPPTPSLAPSFALAGARARPGHNDGGFHTRLNERARNRLAALVPAARAAQRSRLQGPRTSLQQATPVVGTLLQLNASAEGNACTTTDYRTGQIKAVSNRAIVVADTANPKDGFSDVDFQSVAATFDTLIYPVNVAAFGEPQDLDVNGRIIIFYTRAVNELTPANANYVVGGFFYGRDLFPRTAGGQFPEGCEGSNAGELFYMLAPDPAGEVNGNTRSTDYVRNSTLSVVGHEFQHLINASRRLYVVEGVRDTDWSEDPWLNEGLSHIGEELLFYHRAQLAPGMNLGTGLLDQPAALRAFSEFQSANFGRFGEYLRDTENESPYDEAHGEVDDLGTRGAAWGFLRWMADQRAGDDLALWYNLVNNNRVGLANLEDVVGGNALDLFRDFAVASYTDDAVAGVPQRFTHPSWDHRSLYERLRNQYPLPVQALSTAGPVTLTLVAGGAAYLRAGVGAGQRGSVEVTSSGAPPPSALQVTVVRTK